MGPGWRSAVTWLGCVASAPVPVPAPTIAQVDVTVRAEGLTEVYRAAFADEAGPLGAALAGCAEGPVEVDVTYADRIGRIVGRGPWAPGCRPRIARGPDGVGQVELAAVTPIGRAFAAYRNRLATGHDPRLTAFRVGLDLARPGGPSCVVWLAGQVPPDGSAFAATDAPGTEGAVVWADADPALAGCW